MNKILDHLIKISLSETSASLKFQDNLIVYKKIQDIAPNHLAIACQRGVELFAKSDPFLSQVDRNRLLIILFSLTSPNLIVRIKAGPNDLIAQFRQHQPNSISNLRINSCHMQFSNKFVIRKSS